MIRALLALFGIVELVFPDQLIDVFTRLAYRGDGEMEARDWVSTAARVEGAVIVLVALFAFRGRRGNGDEDDDE